MDSPSGLKDIKGKFRTFINKAKLGGGHDQLDTSATTLADFETFISSGLASPCRDGRRVRTSTASTNRGRIIGPLTDFEEEEVLKGLEQQYYRDDFDPVPHEISKFPENFDQAAVDVQRQRLLRQLKVVTKRAFAQILEKRPECNDEMENIRALDTRLKSSLESVRKGRQGLDEARRTFTASSLGILAAYKRRQRTKTLLDNLIVISTLRKTDERLHELLSEGNYPGAIQIILGAQDVAKTYRHFSAVRRLSAKLTDTLDMAEEQLDVALSRVCVDFRDRDYGLLSEAYGLLGKTEASMDQLQMHSASAVHNLAWHVVHGHAALCQTQADVQSETSKKLYADLCACITTTSLLPCLVDLCRALCDVMQSYTRIHAFHVKTSTGVTGGNEYVVKKLANGFQRIWQDVQTKVRVLVTANSVTGLGIDTFIRIMDTIHILIETGRKFCGSESDTLQQSLKDRCQQYFQSYHRDRLEELRMHLDNEGWELCPVKSSFNLLQLKEYRHMSADKVAESVPRSPRKAIKAAVGRSDDFSTPFNNFLDESIMEEDFILSSGKRDNLSDDGDDATNEDSGEEAAAKKSPVLSNTSLMLLRLMGKYLHLMQMLEPISAVVFRQMAELVDFYVVNVFDFFASDLTEIQTRTTVTADLSGLLERIRESFSADESRTKIKLARLSDHVAETTASEESLYGLAAKHVAVESVVYIARKLLSLKPFLDKLMPDEAVVSSYFSHTIEVVIADLRRPVYSTVCGKSVNSETSLSLMSKVAWDIREVRSQHSQYVDVLLREMQIFSIRLQDVADFEQDVLDTLWNLCSLTSSILFIEGFSSAKKCSNEGRALMQLDYRHFVMKLERIAEIKPLPYQDIVTNYIKAYYIPEAELESWVNQHSEVYTSKQMLALINCVAYSNNKAKQKLNQMINDLSDRIRR